MADAALLAVQRDDELPRVADAGALPDAVDVAAKDGETPDVPLENPEKEPLGDVELESRAEADRDADAEAEGLGLALSEAAVVSLLKGVIEAAALAVESSLAEGSSTLALGTSDGVNPSDAVASTLVLECPLADADGVADGDVLALPLQEGDAVGEGEPEVDFDGRRESDTAAVSDARPESDAEPDVEGETVFERVACADAESTEGLDKRDTAAETDALADTDGLIDALPELVVESDADGVGDGRVEGVG